MPTDDQKPPEPPPEDRKPQGQVGSPDGTVPKLDIPIEIARQQIPIPNPDAGEAIRAALEQFEEDATVRDKKSGQWFYLRTRAFVDLKKAKAQQEKSDGHNGGSECDDNPTPPESGVLDPDGSPGDGGPGGQSPA